MQRKMASIQRVRELRPIEGADLIELAKIEGWNCVVKKGEFHVGDLGVYFEIDAVPPDSGPFRFLWTPRTHDGPAPFPRPEKYRIRTMKLRGQLSQGLLMPLAVVDEVLGDTPRERREYEEGDDLTALLVVGKYEPPLPSGDFRGGFPAVLPKTDEVRIQSEPGLLDELCGLPYVVTQKDDGTSATFLVNPLDGQFHACGRNFSILEGENIYWNAARRHELPEVLGRNPDYAVQGELVGPGIQKNRLGLKSQELHVFNVYHLREARYLTHDETDTFCRDHNLPTVATVERGDCFDETVESLLRKAEGTYPGTKNEREGLVIRSADNRRSEILQARLSFKAISNRFLLKEED